MSAEVIGKYVSDDVKISVLSAYASANTTDVTGTELDMAGYDAVLFITKYGTAAANNILTMHHGAVSGTVAASVGLITSGTSDELVILDVQEPIYRYVQPIAARGTSSTLDPIIAIQYRARSKAIDNSTAGTSAVGQFTGPASA